MALRWFMRAANLLIFIGGLLLLGVGVWTINNKTFAEELLRNSLYLNTARVLTAVGCITILLSLFGLYAAQKEVKVLHLTYFVLISVLLLVLAVGAVLAYVFREQVDATMKAEMITDARHYDPEEPSSPITWAWDATQTQLECCGMKTLQVDESWQIWRYSRALNPDEGVWRIPSSCCINDPDSCRVYSNNVTGIYLDDCYIKAKEFVVNHSSLMGGVALGVVAIQALGVVSSLVLFRSIV